MKKYSGKCHCEAVKFSFTLEAPVSKGYRCNCSICKRLAVVRSQKIDPKDFMILSGKDYLHTYLFEDKVVEHQFCKICGIYVFYTGEQCKVNLGCVDGINTFDLAIELFDGEHLL